MDITLLSSKGTRCVLHIVICFMCLLLLVHIFMWIDSNLMKEYLDLVIFDRMGLFLCGFEDSDVHDSSYVSQDYSTTIFEGLDML